MPALLVRHAPTRLNSEGGGADVLRGRLDVPLTPEGLALTAQVASQLAGQPIQHVYAGPLERTAAMGRAISAVTGAPVTYHDELLPWDYGNWTGRPTDEVKPLLDDLVDHPWTPIPGGESFFGFVRRIIPFAMPIIRRPALSVIVTHGRDIKAIESHLAAHCQGIDLQNWRRASLAEPGEVLYATATDLTPFLQGAGSHGG